MFLLVLLAPLDGRNINGGVRIAFLGLVRNAYSEVPVVAAHVSA